MFNWFRNKSVISDDVTIVPNPEEDVRVTFDTSQGNVIVTVDADGSFAVSVRPQGRKATARVARTDVEGAWEKTRKLGPRPRKSTRPVGLPTVGGL